MESLYRRLEQHLQAWLGHWPVTASGLDVVSSPKRTLGGWDQKVHDLVGVTTPHYGVISVPDRAVDGLARLVHGLDLATALAHLHQNEDAIAEALGRKGRFGSGIFRWTEAPTDTPDIGEWVPTDDPRVPAWLRPFNGDVLIAWDDEGNYGAGVGRKQHDRYGHEISVGTEESIRGRGLGRRLVATAARRIIADGAVPTYLHDPSNFASAKVADASGFPDLGWNILGFWG